MKTSKAMNMSKSTYQLGRQMKKITLVAINRMVGILNMTIENTRYVIRALTSISLGIVRFGIFLLLVHGIVQLCTASETEVLAFVATPAPYLQSVAADVLLFVRHGLIGLGETFKELMSPWTDFINTIMSLR